ncbi:unnamed protein product, partial [Didymodactylos carnosus]
MLTAAAPQATHNPLSNNNDNAAATAETRPHSSSDIKVNLEELPTIESKVGLTLTALVAIASAAIIPAVAIRSSSPVTTTTNASSSQTIVQQQQQNITTASTFSLNSTSSSTASVMAITGSSVNIIPTMQGLNLFGSTVT